MIPLEELYYFCIEKFRPGVSIQFSMNLFESRKENSAQKLEGKFPQKFQFLHFSMFLIKKFSSQVFQIQRFIMTFVPELKEKLRAGVQKENFLRSLKFWTSQILKTLQYFYMENFHTRFSNTSVLYELFPRAEGKIAF